MSRFKTLVPRLVLGIMALVLVLGAIPAQAAKPNLKPAISPGPLSHREELRAIVNARAKLTHLELRVDNKKVQPWVRSHAGWKYTISYPLNKLAVGMHTAKLQVRDQQNRTAQRQWQFQKLAQLALTVNKTEIKPGEKVTLTGRGFTPGATVTIGLGGPNTGVGGNYGSAVADRSGGFTVDVTLDKFPDGSPLFAGPVVLLAHTADFAEKASAQLQVQPSPKLTVSKSTVRVGEWVVLNGEGFTPGKVVTIGLAGINMEHGTTYGTAAVDANGWFSTQLFLGRYPDGTPLPPGGITLAAMTPDGEHALVDLQVIAEPAIALNKAALKPGDQVVVTGQNFTPGATIFISMGPVNGGTGGSYGTATVDTNGRFSVPVMLARYPNGSALKPGTIVLLAHTADYSQKASAQLQVLAAPAIAADKVIIQPGDKVTVTGQGFTPGMPVSISLGGVNTGASGNYGTTVTDASGRFSLAVTLERYPNALPLQAGPIVLVAHNASWDEKAAVQLQVVTLSTSPTSVQAGDPITLKGEGFAPGSTMILSMAPNGAAPAGSYGAALVDTNGRFLLTAKLTHQPNGSPLQPGPLMLVVHDPTWTQRASIQIQIADRVPAGPSDLRITSVTRGTTSAEPTVIGLQWRDNSSNETGFRIEATFTRINGGSDTQVWHVAANAATAQVGFVAGGINPVSKVCFTVTAFNDQAGTLWVSSRSNEVCAAL